MLAATHWSRPGASGGEVVMLHGWGLHGGLWQDVAGRLQHAGRVTALDLPGHGRSPWPPSFHDIDTLALAVGRALPADCTLVGWSLGGMAALALAASGAPQVRRLVLVCSTPRFLRSTDWTHGLAPAVAEAFAAELARDWHSTVNDFLSLQVRGDERQVQALRELRQSVFAHGEPRTEALRAGLDVLFHADLRDRLARIAVPTLVISGERDRLTPPGASLAMAEAIPGARHHAVARAGHAPFLSHGAEFARELDAFLAGQGAAP